MTVLDSDNITSTISYLRTNVYSKPQFKAEFIGSFSEMFNAYDFKFQCDQYGGLNIDIGFDPSKFDNEISKSFSDQYSFYLFSDQYSFYLNKASKALQKIINKLGEYVIITPNLINITIVGTNNIIIRI